MMKLSDWGRSSEQKVDRARTEILAHLTGIVSSVSLPTYLWNRQLYSRELSIVYSQVVKLSSDFSKNCGVPTLLPSSQVRLSR